MPGFFSRVGTYMPGPKGMIAGGATLMAMKGAVSGFRNTTSTFYKLNDDSPSTYEKLYNMKPGDSVDSIAHKVTGPASFGNRVGGGVMGSMSGALKGAAVGGLAYGAAHLAMKHSGRLSTLGQSGMLMANRGFSKIKGLFR